ncbi:MAG TPA: hypothetical protein VFP55_04945 [Solirubrobacteraceae bacterium]|nr:hypothetical protein [Solirubrobacteraceae bacterium]
MPHIIVVADTHHSPEQDAVMLRERISASDLESQHFATHLLERLEWAVGDAHDFERADAREAPGNPVGPAQFADPDPWVEVQSSPNPVGSIA